MASATAEDSNDSPTTTLPAETAEKQVSQTRVPMSNIISFYDRNDLIEFIRTYRDLPELWLVSHQNYGSKKKRLEALEKLLALLRKISPNAKLNDVRNKINLLRNNYRKEAKKILESKESGATGDDLYVPNSWLFQELRFLEQIDIKWRKNYCRKRRMLTMEEGFVELEVGREVTVEDTGCPYGNGETEEEVNENSCYVVHDDNDGSLTSSLQTAYGWVARLAALGDDEQRLFAEKAVFDLLFEARLGALNESSLQVNSDASENPLSRLAEANLLTGGSPPAPKKRVNKPQKM